MKKTLRIFSLIIAIGAIFQMQSVKADNYAVNLPGNAVTSANTSSYIKIDGAKIKTKVTSLPFTVEMAFKPSAFNAYGGLWSDRSSGTSTTLQYNNTTNSIRVDYAGTSSVLAPASAVTVLNAWNHVALVITSTSIKLVLNGVTYQRTGMNNTVIPFAGRSYIGQDSASTSTLNRTVTGQFDEIRFWNTARTDAELNANKFKPLVGNEAGLVAYYNFDTQTTSDGTANAINAISPTVALVYKDLTTDASMISSADASGINFSQGVLGADFAAGTTTYTAYVPPTATNTVVVTGNPVAFLPQITQTVDLTQPAPSAAIAITSMDGTATKTYNVNITKTDLTTYWSGNGIATANYRSYPNLWGWKCSDTDNCWSLANSSGTAIRYNDVLVTANTWWASTPTTAWGGRALYLRWDGSGNTTTNSVFSYPVSVVAGKSYTFTYKYAWANNATQPTLTYGVGTDQAGISVFASDTALCSNKKQYLKSKSFTFAAPASGTYYLTFKSSTGALCAVADLTFAEDIATQSVTSNVFSFFFDNLNLTRTFTIGGANLTSDILLTPPSGITLSKTTVTPAEALAGVVITATFDKTTVVSNGFITAVSGTATKNILVNTSVDNCFSALYPTYTNLISSPYLNTTVTPSASWGTNSINSDPLFVYCGSMSGKAGNGTAVNSGSITQLLSGVLSPSTLYRVKAMVYPVDGSFQVGVYGYDNAIATDLVNIVTTTGSWQTVDFTFTTGSVVKPASGVYFNNSGACTGKTGYIDNWEMYALPTVTVKYQDQAGNIIQPSRVETSTLTVGNIYTALAADKAVITSGGITYVYDASSIDNAVVIDGNVNVVLKFNPSLIAVAETVLPTLATNAGQSTTQNITVSGQYLTDVNGIGLALSGTDAGYFSLSSASIVQTGGTVASTVITITYSPLVEGTHSATLTLTSAGAAPVIRSLSGIASLATGLTTAKSNLEISAKDGIISFEATAGESVSVYNSIGQKLISRLAVQGLNSIAVSTHGVLVVKAGSRIGKIVL